MSDLRHRPIHRRHDVRLQPADLRQYARVSAWRFRPAAAARVIQQAEASLLPFLRRQPGFVAHQIRRTGEDAATAVSTWATPEAVAGSLGLVRRWAEDHAAGLVEAIETCSEDVVVDYGPFHEGAHDAAGSWHE